MFTKLRLIWKCTTRACFDPPAVECKNAWGRLQHKTKFGKLYQVVTGACVWWHNGFKNKLQIIPRGLTLCNGIKLVYRQKQHFARMRESSTNEGWDWDGIKNHSRTLCSNYEKLQCNDNVQKKHQNISSIQLGWWHCWQSIAKSLHGFALFTN